MAVKPIEWLGNRVKILDQTRLPLEEVYLETDDYLEVCTAIKQLVIRGAPSIGVAGGYAVALGVLKIETENLDPGLFAEGGAYLTVHENIKMANDKWVDTRTLEDYLDKCYLLPLRNKYPSELSVGEKQRTAFIRAIISHPEILLADEPTGNLDAENSAKIISLMTEFHKNGGTVLLVSHSSEVAKYANRIINLNSGKVINDTQFMRKSDSGLQ